MTSERQEVKPMLIASLQVRATTGIGIWAANIEGRHADDSTLAYVDVDGVDVDVVPRP